LSQLEAEARDVPAGTVMALDWMNGRRTPYSDQLLKGALFGLTLGTTPPMVYRGLVEATVFGTKRIAEHFKEQRVPVERILATGGIAKKSPFIMQLCADVLEIPVAVVASEQTCALGAAIFAATAAGVYASVQEAMASMASPVEKTYRPQEETSSLYRPIYERYVRLADAVEAESHLER